MGLAQRSVERFEKSRNSACLLRLFCMICSFLIYWAGLVKEELNSKGGSSEEAGLIFHKKDLKLHAQEEHELVSFAWLLGLRVVWVGAL